TLNAESSLAWVLRWRRKDEEALHYAREAADGLRETRGPDDLDTMWATYNYATALVAVGRADESANQLEPLLERRYRIFGPSHMDTLIAAWRLAESLIRAGRRDDALAVLERVRANLEDI